MTITQKQALLAYLGYYAGPLDGIWGDKSQRAVIDFQRAYMEQEDVDGIFGAATEKRILEVISTGEQPVKASQTSDEDWWSGIRYWTREEFKCRCGEYHAPYCNGFPVEPDRTLVELADDVRANFGRPGHRSSGIRCPWHNRDSGGKYNSKHLEGKALDFWIDGVSGNQLLSYVQSDPRTNYAYIIEGNIVHMDVD